MLVTAWPAVGARADLVGHQADNASLEIRHTVRACHVGGSQRGHDDAVGAHVGPDVAIDDDAQAENGAIALGSDLQTADVLAGMISRQQVLAPVLDPFHRAPELDGGKGDDEVFGVELATDAEPTAHIGLVEVDAVLGHLQ